MVHYEADLTVLGVITLFEEDERLVALRFGHDPAHIPHAVRRRTLVLARAFDELNEYFSRSRTRFSVPVAPKGTDFMQRVWHALVAIPYGQAISYQELARRIGNANASRAVGQANHRNPIPIIIPCHRVINKDGSLGGFGSGLDVKRYLLALEGISLTKETFPLLPPVPHAECGNPDSSDIRRFQERRT